MRGARPKLMIMAALVLVVGGISLFLLWLWSEENRQLSSKTSPIPVSVAAYAGDTGALIYLAAELGLYQANGLDVSIQDYEAGKLAADALLAGQADLCTSADFVFVKESLTQPSLRIVSTVAAAQVNFLVGRQDMGVNTPKDLADRDIGVTLGSAGEFFLENFLFLHGLSPNSVRMVDQRPSEIVQALISGTLAAGFTWEPNVYRMSQALGQTLKTWPGQSGQDMYFVLLSTSQWLQAHPQAAERLVRALHQTVQHLKDTSDMLPQLLHERFDYESGYIQRGLKANTYEVELSKALLIALEDQARWVLGKERSVDKEIPNYLDMISFSPLEAVSPQDVSIIHESQSVTSH